MKYSKVIKKLTFVTIKIISISASQLGAQLEKSNNMSSDMQGVYCSLSLSKGDFDTSVKSGVLIIPAIVHIAPIVIAAFVLRAVALNCSGLQMAL